MSIFSFSLFHDQNKITKLSPNIYSSGDVSPVINQEGTWRPDLVCCRAILKAYGRTRHSAGTHSPRHNEEEKIGQWPIGEHIAERAKSFNLEILPYMKSENEN